MENLTASEELVFMGRIRTIKPEFWKNEDLSALTESTHMMAAALLNYADDEGYFNANEKLILAECSPLREPSTKIRRTIDELSRIGYLRLGTGPDGREYGHIVKFKQHQRVDRPKPSKIKDLQITWKDSTNNRRTIDEQSTQEVEQGTGKGKEEKKKTLRDSDESTPLSLRRWFDEVMWVAVPSQKKKGKELTWAEIQKLKPDQDTRKEIVTYLSSYYKIKATYDAVGEFMAEMQDPVRVIKNRRFKDVLVPCRGKTRGGGMAPTSAEKNGEPYDRLGYLRLMPDKMKRWKLKMEGESFRRDLIEIGDDPAKYEEAEDAEH